jgi:hypothetical protein
MVLSSIGNTFPVAQKVTSLLGPCIFCLCSLRLHTIDHICCQKFSVEISTCFTPIT